LCKVGTTGVSSLFPEESLDSCVVRQPGYLDKGGP
jgi:hypothetical protein